MWGEMAHCCGAPVIFKRGFQGVPEAGNASASPDRVGVVITDLSRSLLRGGAQRAQTGLSGWPGVLPAPWAEMAQTRLPNAGRVPVVTLVRPSVFQRALLNVTSVSALTRVAGLCRLVLLQVCLRRGQKPWKQPFQGVAGYCQELRVLTLLQWLPWVQHGLELLWGQVVTASLVTNLQGQNCRTATDRGKSPCFQNKVCK